MNSLSVNGPCLVETVVAIPEDNMSMLAVTSTMNIHALSWDVSEVSVWSTVVTNSLESFTLPLSDDSGSVSQESLSSLVGDGIASLQGWSNGVSSSVEDEPLSLIPWLIVVNSESILVSTNVLVPEEGSVALHS